MIGILLVSHGYLASEMKSIIEHIVGPQDYFETVGIFSTDDIEKRREEIQQKVQTVKQDNGVIILTDMFGGTPSNLAISVMDNKDIEVIAGVNIPMLVKLVQIRHDMSLEQATNEAVNAGKKYISVPSSLLNKNED
ncbi:MAG: PTS sugar transporter subunit IIA [Alphaproteobacteria bacterium]|nr:PTS sugar transporter subunit IIA [Alphaproteobacteria bacterium]